MRFLHLSDLHFHRGRASNKGADSALKYVPEHYRRWSLNVPERFHAKPGAIVVPPDSEGGYVFLDALGHGGLRFFPRKQLTNE